MYLLQLLSYGKRAVLCSTFVVLRGLSSNVCRENKTLNHLKAKIEATGPITIADYMKETLISPALGYYMKQDVFGSSGDFVTSPEISQIFGELIGVWFCNEWLKAGKPQPIQYVEFGPGRGTLADDILRVFSKILSPQQVNISVHLIDVSPHMRKLQMKCLGIENSDQSNSSKHSWEETDSEVLFTSKYGYPVRFYRCLETVPEGFSFFLAHEFLDALPIHKFQPEDKRDHMEVCPEAGIFIEKLCKRIKEDGGIALIIDYGHSGTKTDTFRSFKKHKLHDPLEDPGEADLTADVDFSFLRKCTKGEGYVVGPVTQEHFLKNMGIDTRLEKLIESATPEVQETLKSGYDMLMKGDQMGERFKFFAIYPKVLEVILKRYPPAGF